MTDDLRLTVVAQTEEEADALARLRGMTLGQYLRAGGAEGMTARERCRCGDPGDCQECG